jgi:hypothetical protein
LSLGALGYKQASKAMAMAIRATEAKVSGSVALSS